MDDELETLLQPRPWWCRVCGAGDGGVFSDLPPVDHECVFDPIRGNPQGIFENPTRWDLFVDFVSRDKAATVAIGICLFFVFYMMFQVGRVFVRLN